MTFGKNEECRRSLLCITSINYSQEEKRPTALEFKIDLNYTYGLLSGKKADTATFELTEKKRSLQF